jgi:RHS repeat-associated protein
VTGWSGYNRAGQVGLWTNAAGALLDDFDGGTGSGAFAPGAAKAWARVADKPAAQATPPAGGHHISYYYFNGQRVAMRKRTTSANDVYWLHGDHLGSASLTTNSSGGFQSHVRYKPFGEVRNGYSSAGMVTDKLFTGQERETAGYVGNIDLFGARFYSPVLGRFISADTIVPGARNPQAFNRFSYTLNNPLRYTDPTGHAQTDENTGCHGCWTPEQVWNYYAPERDDPNYNYKYRRAKAHTDMVIAREEEAAGRSGEGARTEAEHLFYVNALQDGNKDAWHMAFTLAWASANAEVADKIAGKSGNDAAGIRVVNSKQTYHRIPSDPSELPKVMESGELWGRPKRNIYSSDTPSVKAYVGPLPHGRKGYEFETDVSPDIGSHPMVAEWSGPRPGVRVEDGWAKIECRVTKIC